MNTIDLVEEIIRRESGVAIKDERILGLLGVNKQGPIVLRSPQYKAIPVTKRIALLERWVESLTIELADLEDQYHAEG